MYCVSFILVPILYLNDLSVAKLGNVTVGGTSAGCMVLGNWVYSAQKGSVTSDEALQNPYHRYITIEPAFLKIPFLETVITDTHFGNHLYYFMHLIIDSLYFLLTVS